MSPTVDALLLSLDALAIAIVALGRLVSAPRVLTLQGLLLGFVVLAVHGPHRPLHAGVIAAATIGLRAVVIPWLLARVARATSGATAPGGSREPPPLIGYGTSLVLAGVLMALAAAVAAGLPTAGLGGSDLLFPSALGNVLLGFLLLASRRNALTQVVGYLVMETGVFLAGLPLVGVMPLTLELGVFLDVFLGVFVMGFMVHAMGRTLEHTRTDELNSLRES